MCDTHIGALHADMPMRQGGGEGFGALAEAEERAKQA
jgi:hypothetical protein